MSVLRRVYCDLQCSAMYGNEIEQRITVIVCYVEICNIKYCSFIYKISDMFDSLRCAMLQSPFLSCYRARISMSGCC